MTNHDERSLARVAALLRQAEGTDNEHEAEAFLAAAQRLATAASIDLALARTHSAGQAKSAAPQQRTVLVGERGSKGLRTYVALFSNIGRANRVQCDVARDATYLIAFGFPEDIDATEALYASLMVQMAKSCASYLASGAHHPTPKITARLNFQLAFADRIGARLMAAREEAERQARKAERAAGASLFERGFRRASSTELALSNKELELADFYRQTSKARGSWRAVSSGSAWCARSQRAGERAGSSARIGAQAAFASARRALGR
ncbi:conserved hypothetical protein [Segniliparus rotundus DSM 44985]|uniref:Uncharacterized protein n=1 Tax=Segniliparus rotundus (strain ATCC BAA-972 / CDC 1076 / CIP 108378 / DSM 44985 / JCM 13578) TaxID=640132 RepID=D6ZEB8_SEGRD|nr:DUF2786 domain-containing protein [Segniliparus rotundus]ADG99394.1 conserved hypothetical protein [Segniliparus rotundus DSM 44985]